MDAAQAVTFFEYAPRESADAQLIAIRMDALDHCFSTRADLQTALGNSAEDLQDSVVIPADGERTSLRTRFAKAA